MRPTVTNTELLDTIKFLKIQARQNKAKIWTVTAECLSGPRRNRAVLDLNHISRASRRNSLVLVPGKVLSAGYIKHPVTVAAFQFSQAARAKIELAGGKCVAIKDFVSQNPKGSNVLILR